MGMPPAPSLPASLPISRYNSAKKDNDFIYHEAVPALDTLQSVKGQGLWDPWGQGSAGMEREDPLGSDPSPGCVSQVPPW